MPAVAKKYRPAAVIREARQAAMRERMRPSNVVEISGKADRMSELWGLKPRRWTQGRAIATSRNACRTCEGSGLIGKLPCKCAARGIFRECFRHYRAILAGLRVASVDVQVNRGPARRCVYGRKNEEFCADFELVARRELSGMEAELFRLYVKQGLNWKVCAKRLGVDERRSFWRLVYVMQAKLGRIYADLRPYPLHPLDDYFNTGGADIAPAIAVEKTRLLRLAA